jgi:antitoxin component YwqK of YwqJK toxin-antitoxin module
MKKVILGLLIAAFTGNLVLSQKTVEKISYYDYWELQKKKVWHELGDGTWHGDVHSYREDGTLQSYALMDYGVLLSKTFYFQNGEVLSQMNNNNDGVKHGTQELYTMDRGKKFLKARAEVENGFVKEYKCYFKEGALNFSYTNDGTTGCFKRWDEEGNQTLEISVADGKVTDFEFFGLVLKENRFESVGISTVTSEIKEGRYYICTNFNYEPKSFGYYKIPEQHHFLFDATFNYSDNLYLAFNLDLDLEEKFNDETRFILVLNNEDYDDSNKWSHSANGFKYYLSKLTKDGEYKSYDNNGLCYKIGYEDGTEKWKKNFYSDGSLRMYTNADSTMEYNEAGMLIKESVGETVKEYDVSGSLTKKLVGDKFWVYDKEGNVIDSDEIRTQYKEVNDQYEKTIATYNQFNRATNEIIENDFCLDIGTGEFKSICYTKDNEYIYEAFKTLHMDYLNTWKGYEVSLDEVLAKYPDGSINWKKNIQFPEKIEIMEATIAFCSLNMELIFEFNETIEKFQDLLDDPDVKKINKSFKKAENASEIKALVSL